MVLARVYGELWERQDDDAFVVARVYRFVRSFFPFKDDLRNKLKNFDSELAKMEARVDKLERAKTGADSLTAEAIDGSVVPAEEAEFAWIIWEAVVDVLTDLGFNYPIYSSISFFDPSGGRRSGTGRREGFARVLPGKI